jgi:predicted RNA-binding protein with PUA-like domain
MAYWLVKSEPSTYSWAQMVKDGRTFWSGVRNHQAANNMKAMKKGDRAFFYHSGDDKAVVGTVEIVKEYYPDHTDETGKFGMVDVKAGTALKTPVTLAAIKAEPKLKNLLLIRHSRLSVVPIDEPSWRLICTMGGSKP